MNNSVVIFLVCVVMVCPAFGQVASRAFGGDGDLINLGSDTVLDDLGNADFTACAWVKPSDNSTLIPVFGCGSSTRGWQLWVRWDGAFTGNVQALYRFTTTSPSQRSNESLTADTWAFICARFDISTNQWSGLYIDGSVATYSLDRAESGTLLDDAAYDKYVGSDTTYPFDGSIAYVTLHSRELSVGEINELMHCPGSVPNGLIGYWPFLDSATQYDHSANSNNGTNSGSTSDVDGPPISLCAAGGGN